MKWNTYSSITLILVLISPDFSYVSYILWWSNFYEIYVLSYIYTCIIYIENAECCKICTKNYKSPLIVLKNVCHVSSRYLQNWETSFNRQTNERMDRHCHIDYSVEAYSRIYNIKRRFLSMCVANFCPLNWYNIMWSFLTSNLRLKFGNVANANWNRKGNLQSIQENNSELPFK